MAMDIFIPELGPACLTGVFRLLFQPCFLVRLFQFLMQPLAGFPSASRPVQFAPTWWDPSHCFGKRRKKKSSDSDEGLGGAEREGNHGNNDAEEPDGGPREPLTYPPIQQDEMQGAYPGAGVDLTPLLKLRESYKDD